MPKDKSLTLSVIIPVYNEQAHLRDCLDSIAAQTVKPDEVIVVDNNSTDDSVKIAKSYRFVRVIKEPKQGLIAARNKGFNSAKSDILARIDADVTLETNWVATVKKDFAQYQIAGLTGPAKTRVAIGLKGIYLTFWSRIYFWGIHGLFRGVTMWGANMAISRSIWQQISTKVTLDDSKVHEDQDLSMFVLGAGGRIMQDNQLLIKTEGASYSYWPKFWEYLNRSFATKRLHTKKQTFPKSNPLRLGLKSTWLGSSITTVMTIFFIVYCLAVWPIMTYLVRYKNIR